MDINNYELAELLEDEPTVDVELNEYLPKSVHLTFGYGQSVWLAHRNGQTFQITESGAYDMYSGHTISVDEILDIVL